MTFTTGSEQETRALARALAKHLRGGDVVAYRGGLGAGKTAFTRGLAEGLGITDEVSSPTFAIANGYRDGSGKLWLVHFDMYRIESAGDLEATGYYDYMEGPDPVIYAIEWSENIAEALPDGAITVSFEVLGDTERRITVEGLPPSVEEIA